MASVEFRELRKSYGETEVIHGLSMTIEDGELVVIVGASGCGKSTVLRMVAGLEEISSGEILIDDTVVNQLTPKERDIAMVFQNYALYPHMSVFKNIAYSLKIAGFSKSDILQKVDKVARKLGISDLLDRKPHQLSGGQRQRVAMGRAIVRDPVIFLFDEPLSNLDTKLRAQMRHEIKRLHRSLGVTSIYVTHDQVEAMTLADRLIVMNEGVAEQIGTPMELYDLPQTRHIAGFIGSPSMNFMQVQLTDDGCSVKLHDGISLRLPYRVSPPYSHRSVCLGIRPEHITLAEEGATNSFSVKRSFVEALGSYTLIHCLYNDEPIVVLFYTKNVSQDDNLTIQFPVEAIHVFDSVKGTRLGIIS